ncbi:nucleotidyltransferase domain-containing protein [Cytobacillus praedii]|uniref:nucleotidyltransferase domain-containing protein n=1 Tax=Cytobacillus praedii TaxID=1742358 RepID=UPI002E1CD659|nr:nucleotidyltransferase domain-containing protein [Cytobacillus praedii]MED3575206.1 nucleotidyltransferase domain-containing protein [Cytobacillus praedii]
MVDKRIVKANELIEFFRNHPRVKNTFLRGSLAAGTGDEFSDIDIGINVSDKELG